MRYQLKRLKHETNVLTAKLGPAVFVQLGEILTRQLN
jgi:hypothetical protein